MLKLLRSWLKAGVMAGGWAAPAEKGTPQGGPLSPLLSNIMLDDLDMELESGQNRDLIFSGNQLDLDQRI